VASYKLYNNNGIISVVLILKTIVLSYSGHSSAVISTDVFLRTS